MAIYRVLDIETTGVDPEADKVIEVGSVDFNGDDKSLANAMEQLIDPKIAIPPTSSAVHHLTMRDLKGKPLLKDVLPTFEGADFYVAHNASFEQSFLPTLKPWICTYKTALRVWPDAPAHSNQALRYWLELIDLPPLEASTTMMHRALPDALVTAMIFHQLTEKVSYDQMLEWSSKPALLAKVAFGKHRGSRWYDMPRDYLGWIVTQKFDENVMFTAKYYLENPDVQKKLQQA